tara:strand:+ start:499 stop:1395 length:897 start_codon:yes stop_codon:yes gene_type:complete
MNIKIGIAPIAWSNDDMPELGGDTPIETCLSEAKQAGYQGIELGGKFPRNVKIIKYLLNKFNLKLPGGWYGSELNLRSIDEEWTRMQDQINLLKQLNSDIFVFADVSNSIQSKLEIPLSQRPKLKDDEWKDYGKKVSEIAKRLDDVGIPMTFHEHMGTIIQSEEDVDRLIENTNDKTGLLLDTGHILFSQGDYLKICKKYINRINHIHLKDIRENELKNSLKNDLSFKKSFFKGVFTVPGDGCINYEPIIKLMYTNSYNKWLIVEAEQDPKKANPLEYAKIGFKYLSKIVKDCGYTSN